jgi:N-acetylmuramoyl-L-alanine amidase
MDIGAMVIRGWHKAKGWKDIGYHYVIRRNGEQEKGREDNVMGAHVRGHNSTSLGICLIGGTRAGGGSQYNFTNAQMPDATIHGHNEFAKKACPCFDVSVWFEDNFGNDGES